jgi:hypothetical protein
VREGLDGRGRKGSTQSRWAIARRHRHPPRYATRWRERRVERYPCHRVSIDDEVAMSTRQAPTRPLLHVAFPRIHPALYAIRLREKHTNRKRKEDILDLFESGLRWIVRWEGLLWWLRQDRESPLFRLLVPFPLALPSFQPLLPSTPQLPQHISHHALLSTPRSHGHRRLLPPSDRRRHRHPPGPRRLGSRRALLSSSDQDLAGRWQDLGLG